MKKATAVDEAAADKAAVDEAVDKTVQNLTGGKGKGSWSNQ